MFGPHVRNSVGVGLSGVPTLKTLTGVGSPPTMSLDFVNSSSLDARITFTRADASTCATYFNSSGVMQTALANVPRFDYDPATLQQKGLLIEESRTNLALYSEQIDNATWAKSALTVSANGATSPDGTQNMDKLIATNVNSTHSIRQLVSASASVSYVMSIYVKAAELNKGRLRFGTNIAFVSEAIFDLGAGTVSGTGASISPVGNGVFRIAVVGVTPALTTNIQFDFYLRDIAGNETFTGNNADGLYVWGAQLELGAFSTSYIATTAASVTRAADNAVMTGTNFSNWFNASEGTIFSESIAVANSILPCSFEINNNTTNEEIFSFINASNQPQYQVRTGGSAVVSSTVGANVVNGDMLRIACAYKLNDSTAAQRGALMTTDTSCAMPTVDRMSIGSRLTTQKLNGWVRYIRYYPRRLSNSELAVIST